MNAQAGIRGRLRWLDVKIAEHTLHLRAHARGDCTDGCDVDIISLRRQIWIDAKALELRYLRVEAEL